MAKGAKDKYGVVVLIPSRGMVISKCVETVLREVQNSKYVKRFEIVFSHELTVDKARQWLAEEFVKRTWADYSFWVDDDQVLTKGVLDRLFEAKADFAATHVVNRSPKNIQPGATPQNRMKPIFWFPPDNIRKDFDTGDLTFISLAVSLISRKTFEEIPKPWFDSELDKHLPARYWEDGFFSEKLLKHQRDKFKCVILPEFTPHWELVDFAGAKGDAVKFHSYFHSDVQWHGFRVYDGNTLFPQEDNESMIHGTDRTDIVIADRFRDAMGKIRKH